VNLSEAYAVPPAPVPGRNVAQGPASPESATPAAPAR